MPRDKTGHFFYAWYPTIYGADTQRLTLAQDGAYRRLIDHYMLTRTRLPLEDIALARIIGVGWQEWEDVKAAVLPFFKKTATGYTHSFCEDEIAADNARIIKHKANGAKGGRPRKEPENKEEKPTGLQKQNPRFTIEQNNTDKTEEFTLEPPTDKKKPPRIAFDFEAGTFVNLTQDQIDRWQQAYPAVNVVGEVAAAAAWQHANLKNRKSNYERFLNSWLSRQQDKAPRVATGTAAPASPPLPPLAPENCGGKVAYEFFMDLKHMYGDAIFRSWIRPLRVVSAGETLTLACGTRFMAEWCGSHYTDDMRRVGQKHWPEIQAVKIIVDEKMKEPAKVVHDDTPAFLRRQ